MKLEVSVPEIMEVINEVAKSQGGIFEMIRSDIREKVGSYLSKLMEVELTHYLGRGWYERGQGEVESIPKLVETSSGPFGVMLPFGSFHFHCPVSMLSSWQPSRPASVDTPITSPIGARYL